MPTAYTVSTLADSGPGSLRAAITSVNGDTAADVINFSVAGVIKLTSGPLPAITNPQQGVALGAVTIDGTSAPGFTGAPVVEIDNNGFAGLTISRPECTLASLSVVNASGPGRIAEINPTTLAFSFLTPSGAALSQPDGITSDGLGNLFIASRANADVIEYNIGAKSDTILGTINGLDDLAPASGLGSGSAPEPSSLLMFGAGALGLWAVRRRRRS